MTAKKGLLITLLVMGLLANFEVTAVLMAVVAIFYGSLALIGSIGTEPEEDDDGV